jgi:hypothetical protein
LRIRDKDIIGPALDYGELELMPWTNWGEPINREEMLSFIKQIRNRCDIILQFKPVDTLLYTLLEDIYEDAQAVATGYSAETEDKGVKHGMDKPNTAP